ncbi:MAG: hypothetical protein GY782_10205 [Gammaproteobacteria bacterium]|nr:hypothetical protein [Gammaproteobacteria bacterium]
MGDNHELSAVTIEQLNRRAASALQALDVDSIKAIIDDLVTTKNLARLNKQVYESRNQLLYEIIHSIITSYRDNKPPQHLTDFSLIAVLYHYASHSLQKLQLAQLFACVEQYATKEDERAMTILLALLWHNLIENQHSEGKQESLQLLEQLLCSHFANARQLALDKRYLGSIKTLLNSEAILLQDRVTFIIALFGRAEDECNGAVEKITKQFALLVRRALLALLFAENSDEISDNEQRVARVRKLFNSLVEIEQCNLAVDIAFIIESKRDHSIIDNLSRLFPQLLRQLLLNRYLTKETRFFKITHS